MLVAFILIVTLVNLTNKVSLWREPVQLRGSQVSIGVISHASHLYNPNHYMDLSLNYWSPDWKVFWYYSSLLSHTSLIDLCGLFSFLKGFSLICMATAFIMIVYNSWLSNLVFVIRSVCYAWKCQGQTNRKGLIDSGTNAVMNLNYWES